MKAIIVDFLFLILYLISATLTTIYYSTIGRIIQWRQFERNSL